MIDKSKQALFSSDEYIIIVLIKSYVFLEVSDLYLK